jgi:hypothetical protein
LHTSLGGIILTQNKQKTKKNKIIMRFTSN